MPNEMKPRFIPHNSKGDAEDFQIIELKSNIPILVNLASTNSKALTQVIYLK